MSRTRYLVVGTGNRCQMYIKAIHGEHAEVAELVGVYDLNPARAAYYRDLVAREYGREVPVFTPATGATTGAEEGRGTPREENSGSAVVTATLAPPREGTTEEGTLTEIVAAHAIDRVIITTPDFTHAAYVEEALRAGADVVVEKPLTIDEAGVKRIARAKAETGRDVVVTFNYRYSPRNTALKDVIASGAIGEVTSVDFSWMLDTVHGADYFRRWHRDKANSGGLLVHKASHHFDLVGWWLADVPTRVYASGGLKFYGDAGPLAGADVDQAERDPFVLDLATDERLHALYEEPSKLDGYRRDQDVFAPGVTIEDNMALLVDYARGATLNYSLNAHCPWEGYRVAINGTKGRAELDVVERTAVLPASGGSPVDPSVAVGPEAGGARERGETLRVQRHWGAAETYEIKAGEGNHGGGDALLLTDLFRGPGEDPYGRPAGFVEGVAAISVGIAGNTSLESALPVRVADLDLEVDLAEAYR